MPSSTTKHRNRGRKPPIIATAGKFRGRTVELREATGECSTCGLEGRQIVESIYATLRSQTPDINVCRLCLGKASHFEHARRRAKQPPPPPR